MKLVVTLIFLTALFIGLYAIHYFSAEQEYLRLRCFDPELDKICNNKLAGFDKDNDCWQEVNRCKALETLLNCHE